MPTLGRPDTVTNNFKNIKLRRQQANASAGRKEDLGKQLNQMAGNEASSFKFVDREKHNKMGKNGFLKLLTHQLSNQDPTNPVDQKKFASELAAISQLEQLTNMNSKMDKLAPNAATESKFFAASFLGKEVRTNGKSIDFDGKSESVNIPFKIDKDSSRVIVRLRDEKAQIVRQLEFENLPKGNQAINWDGKGADKLPAVKGKYMVEVLGFDKSGMPFQGKTNSFGKVIGVNQENGEMVLTLQNKEKVFLRDVENFRLPQEEIKLDNNMNGTKQSALSKQLRERIESTYGKQQD